MSIGGLDIGTTGCKLSVYNENLEFVCNSYREYEVSRNFGEHEIDANKVWEAVKEVIVETTEKVKDLEAIGVTSFGESFVLLDENDNVLMPSMLYTDPRGYHECEYLVNKLSEKDIISITGTKPHFMYSLPKAMWIKRNCPNKFEKAKHLLLFQDFIVYMLTGVSQIDFSLASRTMAFDIKNRCWCDEIFEASGIDKNLMSKPVPSGTVAGNVRFKLLKSLNLSSDVKIVSCCHDQVAAAIGAGCFEIGTAVDGSGTVECITPVFNEIPNNMELFQGGYAVVPFAADDKYVCYAITYTSGAILKWFRDQIAKSDAENAKLSNQNVYAVLDSCIPTSPTGLLVLPHFSGAATPYMDIYSKGAIIGLTLEHTEYDIYKAIMEGIVYEMLLNIEKLQQAGITINVLRATGGGASSDVWLQMKADILNRPIIALDSKEVGAAGSVMLSGIAIGKYKCLTDVAAKLVKERKVFYPKEEVNQKYMKIYEKYKNVYNAVRPLIFGGKI